MNTTAYVETGLAPNAVGGICVTGVNGAGEGPASCSPLVYSTADTPGAITFSGITPDAMGVQWDGKGNLDHVLYQVTLSTDDFAANVSTPAPFNDFGGYLDTYLTGLAPNTTYFVRVQAKNGDGLPTGYSEASQRTYRLPPNPPTALTAQADVAHRLVHLSWQAPTGGVPAVGYVLYHGVDPDTSTFTLAYTSVISTTNFDDSAVFSSTWYYQVLGLNADNVWGERSSTASAVLDIAPPGYVDDLRFTSISTSTGHADLAWTAPADDISGVARYFLYTSTNGVFNANTSSASIAASAPGVTVTTTVSISSFQAVFFALTSSDVVGNVSDFSDRALYDPLPPVISSVSVPAGAVLSRPLSIWVWASDNVRVSSVVFKADGVVFATATLSSGSGALGTRYLVFGDTRLLADGAHVLSVTAYDDYGNSVSTQSAVTISYAPPAAPTIQAPSSGFATQVATINVSGVAERDIFIDLQANGVDIATAAADDGGDWSIHPATLTTEGRVLLTAIAYDTRGFSVPSAVVQGTFTSHAPDPPELPTAASAASGTVHLEWSPPSEGEAPSFYRVYRSTDDSLLVEGSTVAPSLLLASHVSTASYDDAPSTDDLYFYGMTSMDDAGNESVLSEVVYALTDRGAPWAIVLISTPAPLGVGVYYPTALQLSEAVVEPPLLTFTPPGGQPVALNLDAITSTLWQATTTISAGMGVGTATFAFQGTDLSGNVGTSLSSASWAIDTQGPIGSVTLSKSSPLSTGTLRLNLSLDESAASTPSLSVTPHGGSALAVSLVSTSPYNNTSWTGTLSVTTNTGDGVATLAYSATDQLLNRGTTLSGGTTSFVIDTSTPGTPNALNVLPEAGGKVQLSWSQPSEGPPASYRVYRDGSLLATVTPSASDGTGSYLDQASDGSHAYAVTAVDLAGNESAAAATDSETADDDAPWPPIHLWVSTNSYGQILVGWQAGSTDTASYFLYRTTYTTGGDLDGLTPQSATPVYVDAPVLDAVYYYSATALDADGNESDPPNEASWTYVGGAPAVVISSVADGASYKVTVFPSYRITDLVLDTGSVHAYLDGVDYFVSGTTVSSEGDHLLLVTAANLAGHVSSATAHFTVDKTPPWITFSVAGGALLQSTGSVSVQVLVQELNLASTAYVLANQTTGSSAAYDSGGAIMTNGSYLLTAQASDKAGNASSATLSFMAEVAPPPPGQLTVTIQSDAKLSWTKPEPDVTAYRVYRDGSRISSSLLLDTFFEDAGWTAGAHVYEVSSVDTRGVEGPRTRATVPAASLGLASLTLTRGYFDALHPTVQSSSSSAMSVGPALLQVMTPSGIVATATAPAVSVGAGQLGTLEGIVAVPASLPPAVTLLASVCLPTDAGSKVTLAGDFTLQAADPAQPLLEVFPDALVPGTLSPVRVRFYNRGSASLDVITAQILNSTYAAVNNVMVKLQTPEGTLFASAGLMQTGNGAATTTSGGRQVYFVTIPPGSSFLFDAVNVLVPNTAATSLSVAALVSTPTYNLASAALPGTESFASATTLAVIQQIPYRATAQTDRAVYDQGSSVTITGQALDTGGTPVSLAPVLVHVSLNGYDRQVAAVTDSSGNYTAGFFPLPNEAGLYTVAATYPSLASFAAHSTFTIVGLAYQYSGYTATLAQGSSYKFTVELQNTGATQVTGLASSTTPYSGSGVSLILDTTTLPGSLAAGAKAVLGLTLSATSSASTSTLALNIVESHGFTRVLPATATVVAAQVIPVITPQQFQIGMLSGETRTVSLKIENKGFASWDGVTLALTTSAPTWSSIQGSTVIGSIPPGGNANVVLSFAPPLGLTNATYVADPLLQIGSVNISSVPVGAAVAVTSSRKGDVLLNIYNADHALSGGHGWPIPGGKGTLVSLDVQGLTFTVTADSNGLATFSQVPSGNYAWRAEATGFQTKSGTAVIEPGLQNTIQAFLPTATVSYQWSVTPTTIQDKYNITLNLTFKTDVPAPTLLIDPPVINLDMQGGQTAYTQYTITNKGLVSAFNVQLNFQGDDAMQVQLPFNSIPEIKAQESVSVPVKITLLHASCHGGAVGLIFDYPCAAGIETTASGPSEQFTAGSCAVDPHNGIPPLGPGGGGGTFGISGGGSYIPLAVPSVQATPTCGAPNAPQPSAQDVSPTVQNVNVTTGALSVCTLAPIVTAVASPALIYSPSYSSLAPQAGETGAGWARPTAAIKANTDGSFTRTNTNASNQTMVPLGPLNQPINGSGPQFAVPVQTFDTLVYQNNTFTQRDKDGGVTKYQVYVSSTYLPVLYTDRNGNTLTYSRDATSGRLNQITDIHGRWISLSYDGNGRVTSASDFAGRSTSYGYDGGGNKTSETDVNGDVTYYAYNSSHSLTQVTYPNGGHRYFTYYSSGTVATEYDDSNNNKNTYGYYASSTSVKDALNHTTVYDWIEVGGLRKIAKVHDPAGGVTSMSYDTNMNLISQTDPLGRTTRFQYDANGNATAITDANSQSTQISYEPNFSQPTSIIDPKGNRTGMSYDASGDLTQVQDAGNNFTQMSYDKGGHVTGVKDPLGHVSAFAYNGNGAMTSATDPLGRTTSMTRDNLSRVTQNTDPAGKQTSFAYDNEGSLTQVTDALSGVTSYIYQHGREDRQLSRVVDANSHATSFGYDAVGRSTSVVNALSQAKTFEYDDKGKPTHIHDAKGQDFYFSYDNLDRLTTLSLPEGDVSYGYDAAGNLASVSKYNSTSLSLTYDGLNRVTQVMHYLPNGYNATLTYTLDANGNRTRMTTPWGTFSYTYDALNRVTSITNPNSETVTFAYDAAGRRASVTYLNGTQTTYAYDAAGQVTQMLHRKLSDSTAVAFANYAYDNAGNRTSMQDAAGTHSYGYDSLYRLTGASHPSGSSVTVKNEGFGYDAVGNRSSDTVIASYSYNNANRLTENSSFTYTYDANGNQTGRTDKATSVQTTFVYDSLNHLTEVDGSSWTIATYKHDPDGNRVEKNVGGTTTRFVYDGKSLLAILSSTNGLVALFTNGPGVGTPLIMHSGSSSYFIHADALGSVRALTDASANVVETAEYLAFGRAVVADASGGLHAQSTVGNPFLYGSMLSDSETGLNHAGAREYDADTGRFLQEDPIPSINQFTYTSNNPLLYIDPLGLYTEVMVWQPVGFGESSFGHVSIDINGTTYTFGPHTRNGVSTIGQYATADFVLLNQRIRSGVGLSLDLTPDQESQLQAYLKNYNAKWSALKGNVCTSPGRQGLAKLGINAGSSPLPVSFGLNLIQSGKVSGYRYYPALNQVPWYAAPWSQ